MSTNQDQQPQDQQPQDQALISPNLDHSALELQPPDNLILNVDVLTQHLLESSFQPQVPPHLHNKSESVSSRVSVGALERREALEKSRLVRKKMELELREVEEKELLELDAQSHSPSQPLTTGALAAIDYSEDEVRARLVKIKEEQLMLENKLVYGDVKREAFDSTLLSRSLEHTTRPYFATCSSKLKIATLKPFSGTFDEVERNRWINNAKSYCANIGLDTSARIDEQQVPQVFHAVRNLLSGESSTLTVPQDWFDLENSNSPFVSVLDLFRRMCLFWKDDHAEENSLALYRKTVQANLKAREFGNLVKQRAAACINRGFNEKDWMETFLDGLSSHYSTYVKGQLAIAKRDGREITFEFLILIASDYDSVSSAHTTQQRKTPAPLNQTSTNSTTSVTPSKVNTSANPQEWITLAIKWQERNLVQDILKWQQQPSRAAPPHIQCYNCGQNTGHYSNTCTNSRLSPKSAPVIISALVSKDVSASPSGKAQDE